jgi:hypothetical protein
MRCSYVEQDSLGHVPIPPRTWLRTSASWTHDSKGQLHHATSLDVNCPLAVVPPACLELAETRKIIEA